MERRIFHIFAALSAALGKISLVRKILVLKPFLLTKANGGEIALLERLKLMKSWGLTIKVIIAIRDTERAYLEPILSKFAVSDIHWVTVDRAHYLIDGIECEVSLSTQFHALDTEFQKPVEDFFLHEIKSFEPDLILTHYTDFFATTAALEWDAQRVWVDQTDDEYPRPIQLQSFPTLAPRYQSISHFIVASDFMRESVSKSYPAAKIHYLPNIIESLHLQTRERGRAYQASSAAPWIFVNPTAVKGVDFVIALAQQLPEHSFLFVGNWGTLMPENLPKNVRTIERQNDVSQLLKNARGLLMPSVWNEAFGRMPLEAMAQGIPVIASNRGALPITVGSGGICLPLEIPLWKRALSQDVNIWQQLVQKGYDRVSEYQKEVHSVYTELKGTWKL
jgi:glycosyltransferase involved in cell wall biosynthesis